MKRKLFTLLPLQVLLLCATATGWAQNKMDFKDSDGNLLMRVNDEGDAGSITLPGLGAVPSVFTDKIYSICGELYFNGQKLSTPWSLNGANIFFNSGNVGVGTGSPNGNAVLDIDAAGHDKGVLLPRLTTAQRTAISGLGASDEGLIVYDETTDSFWFWSGSQWNELGGAGGGDNLGNHTATQTLDLNNNNLSNGGTVTANAFVGDGSGLTNLPPGNGWSLTGNAGTAAETNFIGTTDNAPLEFRVNNNTAFRLHPHDTSPNIIGGITANAVATGVYGATISGGGAAGGDSEDRHYISGIFGTISGGYNNASGPLASIGGGELNVANGVSAAIPGGSNNMAAGDYSVAVGRRAKINAAHDGAFLFSDQNDFDFNSAATNEFAARATGGVRFVTAIDGSGNPTQTVSIDNTGTVTATAFTGDGSGLTGISGDDLGDHTATQTLDLANNDITNGGTVTATAFVGDGSGLTGISGDDLGDHTATQTLDLANNDITNGGTVTATAFVGDGSGLTGVSGDDLGDHTATQTLDLANNDITNGGTVTATAFVGDGSGLTGTGDNLGNHTATQNIDLNGKWLTNDADFNNGIFILTNGNVGIGASNPQAKLEIRPGDDGDPGSDPAAITGLRVDLSSFSGDKTSALFLGGNVGIGTSNPRAPLHVNGTTTIASFSGGNNGGAWMKESSGAGSDEIDWANNAGSTPVSIYANGSIVADGEGVFVAATVNWSDERIKQIEGVSDAKQDLETIDGIEITDYRRIDGGKREKKVIAQQLRKVFPQAVSLREGVIPSIYEHIEKFEFDEANGLLTIETPTPHHLAAGDLVDYYTEAGKFSQQPVASVLSENAFQVSTSSEPQELFVYGKWVSDVHVVDYDAISMLNVSATQELHRIIEAQEQRIAELEAQNSTLASQNSAFEERFAQIELSLRQISDVELTSAENE